MTKQRKMMTFGVPEVPWDRLRQRLYRRGYRAVSSVTCRGDPAYLLLRLERPPVSPGDWKHGEVITTRLLACLPVR